MRTRNSSNPKSPSPPKKTPPARRAASKAYPNSPTVSTPDPASKPRETKRQAAIKAKQAKISDITPPPNPQSRDDDDANLWDNAYEMMPETSSGSNTGAKKGTKRTRGPAKVKAPLAQRIKLEEPVEKNAPRGNEDIEMKESAIEIQVEINNVTDQNEEVNDTKEDAPSETVTNDEVNNKPTEIDHLVVNKADEPSDVCAEEVTDKETSEMKDPLLTEELKKEPSEMKDHLLLPVDSRESFETQKDDNNAVGETVAKLSENQEKNETDTEGKNNEDSDIRIVDETITVQIGEDNGYQPASTEEHNFEETPGEDTKAEGTKSLSDDIMEGADDQHDQDEMKECEETKTIVIIGDPEDLADMEEDTSDEMAGKYKLITRVAGEVGDSGEGNIESDEDKFGETLVMDNDYPYRDADEVKTVEGDEIPGYGIVGITEEVKTVEGNEGPGYGIEGITEEVKTVGGDEGPGDRIEGIAEEVKTVEGDKGPGFGIEGIAEEVKKVEGDEEPGNGFEGMAGEGKKYVKDDNLGSSGQGVVECLKGPESAKAEGDNVISNLIDERDEPKVDENLERNMRESVEDGFKFEEEHREWTAVAKERRIKKEHEIFVREIGGDTKEEDLRKVFEEIGEVIEVRLHKQSISKKNKGYAFVRFADKEHVRRALTEIKDPIIGGLSCSIGPSEDNDTLFLGNVCSTWTKETIKLKLKEYGVEGVENITLVPDAQREGFSRGFAFLEFTCHDDAVVAYQRLQKPDVIFGHTDRTAKVAFAEPLRDPDPDVMLKVKTVFVDGLPSTCDDKYVQEKVKGYGEIERIVLARYMPTAKRKDFGFIHFTTHEAAMACIDGINNTGLGDENSKTKIKARLSNPLPKTQAVKDGMAGGFRIGFSSSGGASKSGRGVGRDGHLYRQGDSKRGRVSYQRGYGQSGRAGFASGNPIDTRFGGRASGQGLRVGFRPHEEVPATVGPFISNHVRPMSVPGDASRGIHAGPRQQARFEGGFGRHHNQRQSNDLYAYGQRPNGTKRPSSMTDIGNGYVESSRRPRLNYTDPPPTAAPYSFHGTQSRDRHGPPSDIQPHNYYGHPANSRPVDYYGPPTSARPLDHYGPPPRARPHDYYGPPPRTRPPEYGPPFSTRPPEYYGPLANIRPHVHSGLEFIGGPRPPAYRGNPPNGGGFHY